MNRIVNMAQILSSMLMNLKHIMKSIADVAIRIIKSSMIILFLSKLVQMMCHKLNVNICAHFELFWVICSHEFPENGKMIPEIEISRRCNSKNLCGALQDFQESTRSILET